MSLEQNFDSLPQRDQERFSEIQNSKEVISYEDFISEKIRGTETHGNFWMKFYEDEFYEKEERLYYQRFKESHPELEKYIVDQVKIIGKNKTSSRRVLLRELAPKLYEAYLVMIADEDVKSNYELFG